MPDGWFVTPEHAARLEGTYEWPLWGWPHEYATMFGEGVVLALWPKTKFVGRILQPVLQFQVFNYLVHSDGEID